MSVDHWAEMIRHYCTVGEVGICDCLSRIKASGERGFAEDSDAVRRLRLEAGYMRKMADRFDAARQQLTERT